MKPVSVDCSQDMAGVTCGDVPAECEAFLRTGSPTCADAGGKSIHLPICVGVVGGVTFVESERRTPTRSSRTG
jgi:hypothetical protein